MGGGSKKYEKLCYVVNFKYLLGTKCNKTIWRIHNGSGDSEQKWVWSVVVLDETQQGVEELVTRLEVLRVGVPVPVQSVCYVGNREESRLSGRRLLRHTTTIRQNIFWLLQLLTLKATYICYRYIKRVYNSEILLHSKKNQIYFSYRHLVIDKVIDKNQKGIFFRIFYEVDLVINY